MARIQLTRLGDHPRYLRPRRWQKMCCVGLTGPILLRGDFWEMVRETGQPRPRFLDVPCGRTLPRPPLNDSAKCKELRRIRSHNFH
jgi:hypothetical protein